MEIKFWESLHCKQCYNLPSEPVVSKLHFLVWFDSLHQACKWYIFFLWSRVFLIFGCRIQWNKHTRDLLNTQMITGSSRTALSMFLSIWKLSFFTSNFLNIHVYKYLNHQTDIVKYHQPISFVWLWFLLQLLSSIPLVNHVSQWHALLMIFFAKIVPGCIYKRIL